MQAFWDVLWEDVRAFLTFVGPMLLLSLPASGVGALFGTVGVGLASWSRVLRAIGRGMAVGSLAAVLLGMLLEYAFRLEGLANARRALRETTIIPLWGAAIAIAVGAGFFASRRYAQELLDLTVARRRFTLLQLFAAQLIAGLFLGWWAFTRRDEISNRRVELAWEIRERETKALFEPLGWHVFLPRGENELSLITDGNTGQVHDDTLALVSRQSTLTFLMIDHTGLTDSGLKQLASAQRLRRLQIVAPQITDDGVLALCQLPRLRYLTIESPLVTGASLNSLAKVRSLRYVSISSNRITPDEQAAFRQARPDVDLRVNSGGS